MRRILSNRLSWRHLRLLDCGVLSRRDFTKFKTDRAEHERLIAEYNAQNGATAPLTSYKTSIDESVLEQLVIHGMVPADEMTEVTEEHLKKLRRKRSRDTIRDVRSGSD